jgi:hypothetical protein
VTNVWDAVKLNVFFDAAEVWPVANTQNEKHERLLSSFMTYTERGPAGLVFEIQERVASLHSPYQHIEVYKDGFFGNIMVIDDDLMLTELDEVRKGCFCRLLF